ncbi:MAG TPA: DUF4190 domain-containing protein [Acidimicrobiales bacterium]|nr:DUF4190 domain-containing protein [Acidimicrobiales bacterium]
MAARCVNGHDTPRGQACMYCGAPLAAPAAPPPAAYAAPPQGPPPGWSQAPAPGPTSGLAIASLVLGILYPIGSIPALICGWLALDRIRTRNQSGRGLAIAGIVLGSIGTLFAILAAIVVLGVFTSSGVVDKDGTTGSRQSTSRGCLVEYRTLRTATEAYNAQYSTYPASLDDLYGTFLNEDARDDIRFRFVAAEGHEPPRFEALDRECEGVGD